MNELIKRYHALEACENEVNKAVDILISCFKNGGKLLLSGNGGSAADCEHISGELMKGFMGKRPLSSEQKATMQSKCKSISQDTLDKLQNALDRKSVV